MSLRLPIATLALVLSASPGRADTDKDRCAAASESGQQLALDGKLVAARAQFLVCAQDLCPAPVRKDCLDELTRVDARTPTVVLLAVDSDGAAITDATVRIDGAAASVDGKALAIDPGPHVFRFERPNGGSVEVKAIAVEGRKLESVRAVFPAPKKPAPAATVVRSGVPTLTYVFGAVSLVGFAGFTYFGLDALGDSRDLHARNPRDFTRDDVDALRRKILIADISLAVGVLGLGAATYTYFTRPEIPASQVSFQPIRGGGVAMFATCF